MVKFLLNKPIAVTMTFIAIMIVGIVSMTRIPVSLMPDIAIPEITVQISETNVSARELENSVVRPIRQQLMQVAHLNDITSETTDGNGTIKLTFEYGTDIDFAFIEVNEKVDRAMNYLPNTIGRPKVIKASIGDIPVFYLNLTLKKGSNVRGGESLNVKQSNSEASNSQTIEQSNDLYPFSQDFVELSRFTANVICKRLEQLPEVAMVDMSGLAKTEILIMPDLQKLDALGITLDQLEQSINSNNIKLGNLSIRDGQYQYNVRFATSLKDKHDIEAIYLKTEGHLYQLKDIATVINHPQKPKGVVLSNGQNAITLAVIKQADAQMSAMKKSLNELVANLEKDYPDIQFEITRDQTKLLDYSISNLGQSLWLGGLLAFLVMFLFLRDFKSPFLIGITMPIGLVVSLFVFYLVGLSINIISLSGLILGVGMMVDNSIIVIDNITQHYQRRLNSLKDLKAPPFEELDISCSNTKHPTRNVGQGDMPNTEKLRLLFSACVSGTNEVIRPMLSAVLTTCAVFVPLIFISGISGSLFYDQAMAVTIGLFSSLIVAITLLPVYYFLFYKKGKQFGENSWLKKVNGLNYEAVYEKGFRIVMRNQKIGWAIIVCFLIGSVILYRSLPKSKLPVMEKDEMIVDIDWNNPISVQENRQRVDNYMAKINPYIEQYTGLIGEQQFLIDKNSIGNGVETLIYMKAKSPAFLDSIKLVTAKYFGTFHSDANYSYKDADNIFNVIFSDDEPPLEAIAVKLIFLCSGNEVYT